MAEVAGEELFAVVVVACVGVACVSVDADGTSGAEVDARLISPGPKEVRFFLP